MFIYIYIAVLLSLNGKPVAVWINATLSIFLPIVQVRVPEWFCFKTFYLNFLLHATVRFKFSLYSGHTQSPILKIFGPWFPLLKTLDHPLLITRYVINDVKIFVFFLTGYGYSRNLSSDWIRPRRWGSVATNVPKRT